MMWHTAADRKPPLHQQMLVELREGVGTVCDVATYLGAVEEDGATVERWLLADVRLNTRQIKRWADIYPEPPQNALRKAFDAAWRARGGYIDGLPACLEHEWSRFNGNK